MGRSESVTKPRSIVSQKSTTSLIVVGVVILVGANALSQSVGAHFGSFQSGGTHQAPTYVSPSIITPKDGPGTVDGVAKQHFSRPSVLTDLAFPPRSFAQPYATGESPMGIVDYGQADGSTEYYYTNSFQGSATIDGLSVCAASSPCGSTDLGFQLDVNLGFEDGGSWYDYWIQDVAAMDSSTHEIQFIDNVWNLSSSDASIYTSTLSGSGGVGSSDGIGFYYDEAAYYLPGNLVDLDYPGTFDLTVNASVASDGQPAVDFAYSDAAGAATFDSVTFSFVSQLDYSDGFIVDGENSNPAGLAYDAEMVMGGPGGGSNTIDESSNLQLTLQYWNGYNYETVNNAANYGEDTAETISDADVAAYYYDTSGSVYAQVSAGTETLGTLWYSNDLAFVKVIGPGSSNANLSVGPVVVPYLSGNATIALAPTTIDFQITCDGFSLNLGGYTLTAGSTTDLYSGIWTYVSFGETGLPLGRSWGISIQSDKQNVTASVLNLYLPVGEYNFTVFGGAGFLPTPSAGELSFGSPGEGIVIDWVAVDIVSSAGGSVDVGQIVNFSVALGSGYSGDTFAWNGLPPGCTPTDSSQVSCTPTGPSKSPVNVSVTELDGFTATSPDLPFTVFPLPTVGIPSALSGGSILQGQDVTFDVISTPGSGGLVFTWNGLPTGCQSVNSTVLTCTPSASGTWRLSVTVTDSNGGTATSATLAFTVQPSFLGLPALEGYGIVGVGIAALFIGIFTVILVVRRRRWNLQWNDESIAKRVSDYAPIVPATPMGGVVMSPSEVWQDRAGGTSTGSTVQSTVRDDPSSGPEDPRYWDSPLVNPPERTCWNCQFQNPPGSRYCARCGLPLQAPAEAEPTRGRQT